MVGKWVISGPLFFFFGCSSKRNSPCSWPILLQQLKNTTEEDGFIPLNTAMEGIPNEPVNWNDNKENHAVDESVSHPIFWYEGERAAHQGKMPTALNSDYEATFSSSIRWEATINIPETIQTPWKILIANTGGEQLDIWNRALQNSCSQNANRKGQLVYKKNERLVSDSNTPCYLKRYNKLRTIVKNKSMCHKTEVLNQTKNGFLMSCSCSTYHLTFGHFYLELTAKELTHFGAFIIEIDANYWDHNDCQCTFKRKIPIPTQQHNLCIMLNRTELEELKRLVFFKEKRDAMQLIQVEDVDYDFIKN